jgi:hypothetical protein
MEEMTVGRRRFQKMFRGRAVVVTKLPPGYGMGLANRVNDASGRCDVSLRTTAEHLALFELLLKDADVVAPDGELALIDERGQPTAAGRAVEEYIQASQGTGDFFDADMFMFHITGLRLPRRIPGDIIWQQPARGVAHRSGGPQAHPHSRWRGCTLQHLTLCTGQLRKQDAPRL